MRSTIQRFGSTMNVLCRSSFGTICSHRPSSSAAKSSSVPWYAASAKTDSRRGYSSHPSWLKHRPRPYGVVHVGRIHGHGQDEPEGVYDEMALTSGDLLATVYAPAVPLFSATRTDWLSRMAAEGVSARPAFVHTEDRSASCTASIVPLSLQWQYCCQTAGQGGRSCGSARHVQPFLAW